MTKDPMHVYLDWDVFNAIEKRNSSNTTDADVYEAIEKHILLGNFVVPYSNAHVNHLKEGSSKNPSYLEGHLEVIERLTNNLCIVQYWGQQHVTWHIRDVREFLESAIEEGDFFSRSFQDLGRLDTTGLWSLALTKLKSAPLPQGFSDLFKADPVFLKLFPKARVEKNMLAMCEDIFEFQKLVRRDFSVYKSLRSYVNQAQAKARKYQKVLKEVNKTDVTNPSHLEFIDNAWEQYRGQTKVSDNPAYQRITSEYAKTDFKGVKSDEKFPNMIDDSLHVFYGAHCGYFITLDDKCHYKANEVYRKLKIDTLVMKPKEFVKWIEANENKTQ